MNDFILQNERLGAHFHFDDEQHYFQLTTDGLKGVNV